MAATEEVIADPEQAAEWKDKFAKRWNESSYQQSPILCRVNKLVETKVSVAHKIELSKKFSKLKDSISRSQLSINESTEYELRKYFHLHFELFGASLLAWYLEHETKMPQQITRRKFIAACLVNFFCYSIPKETPEQQDALLKLKIYLASGGINKIMLKHAAAKPFHREINIEKISIKMKKTATPSEHVIHSQFILTNLERALHLDEENITPFIEYRIRCFAYIHYHAYQQSLLAHYEKLSGDKPEFEHFITDKLIKLFSNYFEFFLPRQTQRSEKAVECLKNYLTLGGAKEIIENMGVSVPDIHVEQAKIMFSDYLESKGGVANTRRWFSFSNIRKFYQRKTLEQSSGSLTDQSSVTDERCESAPGWLQAASNSQSSESLPEVVTASSSADNLPRRARSNSFWRRGKLDNIPMLDADVQGQLSPPVTADEYIRKSH